MVLRTGCCAVLHREMLQTTLDKHVLLPQEPKHPAAVRDMPILAACRTAVENISLADSTER